MIQVIGFFFLRLYVAGEHEIHYIRNEITNLEMRLIAYSASALAEDAVSMKDVIEQLVRTERNFKLRKGEKTLYATDDTYNDMGQILKNMAEVIKAKTKKDDD